LQAGEPFDKVEKGRTTEGPRLIARTDPSVPTEIRAKAFSLPHPAAGQPLYQSVETADGAALIALLRVSDAPPMLSDAQRSERLQQLAGQVGPADVIAYIGEARRKASVSVNPKAFE